MVASCSTVAAAIAAGTTGVSAEKVKVYGRVKEFGESVDARTEEWLAVPWSPVACLRLHLHLFTFCIA